MYFRRWILDPRGIEKSGDAGACKWERGGKLGVLGVGIIMGGMAEVV
ncbi:MAG: hypothetical protein ACI9F9_002049 [Candidatus Paceibacteria bacterium]